MERPGCPEATARLDDATRAHRRGRHHDERRVLQEPCVLLRQAPVHAEHPPGADEQPVVEAAAQGGVRHESPERHAGEAGRDRDQAAHHRDQAADQDGLPAVAVEPGPSPVEVRLLEQEKRAEPPDQAAQARLAEAGAECVQRKRAGH